MENGEDSACLHGGVVQSSDTPSYSFAIAASRRAIVSSLPSRYAISNAPPGVAARPVMAMRSGQRTVAFFMPDSGNGSHDRVMQIHFRPIRNARQNRTDELERGLARFRGRFALFVRKERDVQLRHFGKEINHARKLAENLGTRLKQLAQTVKVELLRIENLSRATVSPFQRRLPASCGGCIPR